MPDLSRKPLLDAVCLSASAEEYNRNEERRERAANQNPAQSMMGRVFWPILLTHDEWIYLKAHCAGGVYAGHTPGHMIPIGALEDIQRRANASTSFTGTVVQPDLRGTGAREALLQAAGVRGYQVELPLIRLASAPGIVPDSGAESSNAWMKYAAWGVGLTIAAGAGVLITRSVRGRKGGKRRRRRK